MIASLLVPPVGEPVSLAEAKAWLRLETADEDALVNGAIAAARAAVEAATRRLLVSQTWRLLFDGWQDCAVASPFGGASLSVSAVPIPLAPVAAIAAVRTLAADAVARDVATTDYRLCGLPDQARVIPAGGWLLTPIESSRVEVDAVVGYGATADVPAPLRQAILTTVAQIFEHRGDEVMPPASILGPVARELIAPFRRVRLA